MTKTDKHGNILAVGDTLLNRKGEEAKIENISGVAMLISRHENRAIKKTIVFFKSRFSTDGESKHTKE